MDDTGHDVIFDQGVEAAYSASYPPKLSEWQSPYSAESTEDAVWLNGFRHQYQKDNH